MITQDNEGELTVGVFGAPRVPHDFVPRARIDSLFETDAALVVVRAAAGAGKTVAAASWAARAGSHSGAWLTVREGCASSAGFWRSVIELFGDAGLLPADSVLLRSLSSLDDVSDLGGLLQRGFAHLAADTVLVLDDAQFIADDRIYDELVEVLARTSTLRAVVLTRTMSPLESDDVHLRLSPVTVAPSELALTESETLAVLVQAGVEPPSSDFAGVLRQAVSGSPLFTRGVILAQQRGDLPADVDSLIAALETPGFQGLRQAIMANSGAPHEIDFAVRCSVPDSLTVELAQQLTGRDDAAELLADLEAAGIGLWSHANEGARFTLSPLFRAALRAEVATRFAAEEAQLHTISATDARARGDYLAALGHAFSAGDLALASGIVLAGWIDMPGPPSVITDRVGPLSLRTLHRAPLLTMLLALKYNAVGTHKAQALEMFGIAAISSRVRGKKEPLAQRFVLALLESVALRLTGRSDAAVSAADHALELHAELSVEDRDGLSHLLPVFYTQVGQSYLYGGQSARALGLFHAAVAFPRELSERGWYHGLALTAGVSAMLGEMDEAIRISDIAREERWPEGWRDGYVGSMYQVAEAHRALEEFDFDRAEHHIGLLAPHAATIEHWPSLLHVRAMISLGRGRPNEGIRALEVEPTRHGRAPSRTSQQHLDMTHSLLLTAAGRTTEAREVVAKHPKSSSFASLSTARVEMVTGKPEQAVIVLGPLLAPGATLSPRFQADALLIMAAASLRLQRTESAVEYLAAATDLMRDRRLRLPLMLLQRSDLVALSHLPGDSDVDSLFSHLDRVPDVLPRIVSSVTLSAREQVVLAELASSGSAAEIAERLFVSHNTVKSHLRSLYRKLDVKSREEALIEASERGLIQRQL